MRVVFARHLGPGGVIRVKWFRRRDVIERANPETGAAQPAPDPDDAASGVRHALVGFGLVLGWLVLCLLLWKVF